MNGVQTLDFGITARQLHFDEVHYSLGRKYLFPSYPWYLPLRWCRQRDLPPPVLIAVRVGLTGHRGGLRFKISRIVTGILWSTQLARF